MVQWTLLHKYVLVLAFNSFEFVAQKRFVGSNDNSMFNFLRPNCFPHRSDHSVGCLKEEKVLANMYFAPRIVWVRTERHLFPCSKLLKKHPHYQQFILSLSFSSKLIFFHISLISIHFPLFEAGPSGSPLGKLYGNRRGLGRASTSFHSEVLMGQLYFSASIQTTRQQNTLCCQLQCGRVWGQDREFHQSFGILAVRSELIEVVSCEEIFQPLEPLTIVPAQRQPGPILKKKTFSIWKCSINWGVAGKILKFLCHALNPSSTVRA